MELDGAGAWTVAGASERREKRIKYAADNSAAHMVYITGSEEIIRKMNPLKVREKLVLKFGAVDGISFLVKACKYIVRILSRSSICFVQANWMMLI